MAMTGTVMKGLLVCNVITLSTAAFPVLGGVIAAAPTDSGLAVAHFLKAVIVPAGAGFIPASADFQRSGKYSMSS